MKFNVKAAIITGLFYAIAMAAWDYHDGVEFNPFRFIINFFVFGCSWFAFEYWQVKNKN